MFTPTVLVGVVIGVLIVAAGTFFAVRGHLRREHEDDLI
jgi:hypothetical protein